MNVMHRLFLAFTAVLVVVVHARAPLVAQSAGPAPLVERDVVYGMYSGLALLMDVHRPSTPNRLGIVAITGVGFHAGAAYGSPPMKEIESQLDIFVKPLVGAGYTVFV